jgi:hypothetical protein
MKLTRHAQTVLVFAARYAHNRKTYAASIVCDEIRKHWANLDENTRTQIIRESEEAGENRQTWQDLRMFAEKYKPNTSVTCPALRG